MASKALPAPLQCASGIPVPNQCSQCSPASGARVASFDEEGRQVTEAFPRQGPRVLENWVALDPQLANFR